MGDDDARKIILARRAKFVAAADADAAIPQPCLAPLPPDASDDADADDGG